MIRTRRDAVVLTVVKAGVLAYGSDGHGIGPRAGHGGAGTREPAPTPWS